MRSLFTNSDNKEPQASSKQKFKIKQVKNVHQDTKPFLASRNRRLTHPIS